jgi:hypothetical protein
MKNNVSKLELACVGAGALLGFAVLKFRQLSGQARHFDVLYSVHGAKFRFAGAKDRPQSKTLEQARSLAERFAISAQLLKGRATVVNLQTGEVVAQF